MVTVRRAPYDCQKGPWFIFEQNNMSPNLFKKMLLAFFEIKNMFWSSAYFFPTNTTKLQFHLFVKKIGKPRAPEIIKWYAPKL